MASLLHSALGWSDPDSQPVNPYEVTGVGLWHPDDTDYMQALFDPRLIAGRTPYRVTNDAMPGQRLPRGVTLLNLDKLLDQTRFRPVSVAGSGPRELERPNDSIRSFGTTRVFRFVQQSGSDLEQLSRVDWELPSPKVDGRQSWVTADDSHRAEFKKELSSFLKQLQKVEAVVVKDIGKGVVSQPLLEAILGAGEGGRGSPLATKPWFVSTRYWDPPWLKWLAAHGVNVQLVFYSDVATRQVKHVPSWVTSVGRLTKEAISALKGTANLVGAGGGRRPCVVVNLKQFRTIALDQEGDGLHCFVQHNPNPNHVFMGFDVGRPSVMFGAFAFGMLQRKECGGAVEKPIGTKALLEGALGVTERWLKRELEFLQNAPASGRPPEPMIVGVNGPDRLGRDYRLATPLDSTEAELDDVGDVVTVDVEEELRSWDRSTREFWDTVVDPEGERVAIMEGWRATAELIDYVCCNPAKRKLLARFRDEVIAFNPKKVRRPLTALVTSKPGAGKSFLVDSLKKTVPNLRVLSFNITTMMRREDLLACFDQIVTTQLQHREEKLLVFFDEVNADLENHSVYDAFLAPLEDSYYLRAGIKFLIRPCIWLFAGTCDQKEIKDDKKGSDFISRLSFGEIDLTSHREEDVTWKKIENVYLGVALARARNLDLRRVRRCVPAVLYDLNPELSNRSIRQFMERNLEVADGLGDWKNPSSIYDDNAVCFNLSPEERGERQRALEQNPNHWVVLRDRG